MAANRSSPAKTQDPPGALAQRARAPVIVLLGQVFVPALITAFAIAFLISSWHLGPKTADWPRAVIVVLIPLCLYLAVTELVAWRRTRTSEEGVAGSWTLLRRSALSWRRSGVAIFTLALYIAVVSTVGFYTCTAIYLLVTFWLLGVRKPLPLVALTAGSIAFSYLFFYQLLGLALPIGWFY